LGGVRIVCQFVEDIETVVELIRSREDFQIVEERDYVNNEKPSGYRSYHIIIRYPVQTISGIRKIFSRVANSYNGDEFLGNDRTFTKLQV